MPESGSELEYVCPYCRGALGDTGGTLECRRCDKQFPVESGIADFSEGRYYDRFLPGQEFSPEQAEGLANEIHGSVSRIRDFYLPLLEARQRTETRQTLRVLDVGCGNGLSVEALAEAGLDARGVDLSALRKWQWRERRHRERLICADASRLPFPNGSFDAILSSGVLEHIGVEEHRGNSYSVRPLPDQDKGRAAFLAEQCRVLAEGGVLFLDFPNGAFPIDFWHGTMPGGARFHRRDERFLPTVAEVRAYLAAVSPEMRVRPMSPVGRLRFRQVGRHWYGKLFGRPVGLLLRALEHSPWMLETALNPYLVLEVSRPSSTR